MSRISPRQVSPDAIDDVGVSVTISPRRASDPRYGTVYDPARIAGVVPGDEGAENFAIGQGFPLLPLPSDPWFAEVPRMMKVEELLRSMPKREVVTIDVAAPLSRAVTLFKERGFSQVPVTDGGKLAGILTEADARRVAAPPNIAQLADFAQVPCRACRWRRP